MMMILKEIECRCKTQEGFPRLGDTIYCFGGSFKVIALTQYPDKGGRKVASLKLEPVKK